MKKLAGTFSNRNKTIIMRPVFNMCETGSTFVAGLGSRSKHEGLKFLQENKIMRLTD